uniref:Ion transport domain-containing protein n=1 Tax=Chromera velia CCMP2878 TaxID=1169474 RepID=A0A0G4HA82_9ALVE|eukprot:Cvel_25627.t1-p1 / transcript=Cvel_25627.t1 / gene=Cvel_25627 / organism=Chromera_velia_CCMP2878 / gene_product=hypothetical protein / transcript_product=hypothetical protein / location=Cvel_scaffold2929:2614-18608(+) / protein_length=2422 / sequence_SO=supercontig / SO=protein_coding / is_pseudo=false
MKEELRRSRFGSSGQWKRVVWMSMYKAAKNDSRFNSHLKRFFRASLKHKEVLRRMKEEYLSNLLMRQLAVEEKVKEFPYDTNRCSAAGEVLKPKIKFGFKTLRQRLSNLEVEAMEVQRPIKDAAKPTMILYTLDSDQKNTLITAIRAQKGEMLLDLNSLSWYDIRPHLNWFAAIEEKKKGGEGGREKAGHSSHLKGGNRGNDRGRQRENGNTGGSFKQGLSGSSNRQGFVLQEDSFLDVDVDEMEVDSSAGRHARFSSSFGPAYFFFDIPRRAAKQAEQCILSPSMASEGGEGANASVLPPAASAGQSLRGSHLKIIAQHQGGELDGDTEGVQGSQANGSGQRGLDSSQASVPRRRDRCRRQSVPTDETWLPMPKQSPPCQSGFWEVHEPELGEELEAFIKAKRNDINQQHPCKLHLLSTEETNPVHSVRFSPNCKSLACICAGSFMDSGRLLIYDITPSGGERTETLAPLVEWTPREEKVGSEKHFVNLFFVDWDQEHGDFVAVAGVLVVDEVFQYVRCFLIHSESGACLWKFGGLGEEHVAGDLHLCLNHNAQALALGISSLKGVSPKVYLFNLVRDDMLWPAQGSPTRKPRGTAALEGKPNKTWLLGDDESIGRMAWGPLGRLESQLAIAIVSKQGKGQIYFLLPETGEIRLCYNAHSTAVSNLKWFLPRSWAFDGEAEDDPDPERCASLDTTGDLHVFNLYTGEPSVIFVGHRPTQRNRRNAKGRDTQTAQVRRQARRGSVAGIIAKKGAEAFDYADSPQSSPTDLEIDWQGEVGGSRPLVVAKVKAPIRTFCLHPGGLMILCGHSDGGVRMFDAFGGQEIGVYYGHEHNSRIQSIDWSRQDTHLCSLSASPSEYGVVHVYPTTIFETPPFEYIFKPADREKCSQISSPAIDRPNTEMSASGKRFLFRKRTTQTIPRLSNATVVRNNASVLNPRGTNVSNPNIPDLTSLMQQQQGDQSPLPGMPVTEPDSEAADAAAADQDDFYEPILNWAISSDGIFVACGHRGGSVSITNMHRAEEVQTEATTWFHCAGKASSGTHFFLDFAGPEGDQRLAVAAYGGGEVEMIDAEDRVFLWNSKDPKANSEKASSGGFSEVGRDETLEDTIRRLETEGAGGEKLTLPHTGSRALNTPKSGGGTETEHSGVKLSLIRSLCFSSGANVICVSHGPSDSSDVTALDSWTGMQLWTLRDRVAPGAFPTRIIACLTFSSEDDMFAVAGAGDDAPFAAQNLETQYKNSALDVKHAVTTPNIFIYSGEITPGSPDARSNTSMVSEGEDFFVLRESSKHRQGILVQCVAFTPNGRALACGGEGIDGVVLVDPYEDHILLMHFNQLRAACSFITFHPDPHTDFQMACAFTSENVVGMFTWGEEGGLERAGTEEGLWQEDGIYREQSGSASGGGGRSSKRAQDTTDFFPGKGPAFFCANPNVVLFVNDEASSICYRYYGHIENVDSLTKSVYSFVVCKAAHESFPITSILKHAKKRLYVGRIKGGTLLHIALAGLDTQSTAFSTDDVKKIIDAEPLNCIVAAGDLTEKNSDPLTPLHKCISKEYFSLSLFMLDALKGVANGKLPPQPVPPYTHRILQLQRLALADTTEAIIRNHSDYVEVAALCLSRLVSTPQGILKGYIRSTRTIAFTISKKAVLTPAVRDSLVESNENFDLEGAEPLTYHEPEDPSVKSARCPSWVLDKDNTQGVDLTVCVIYPPSNDLLDAIASSRHPALIYHPAFKATLQFAWITYGQFYAWMELVIMLSYIALYVMWGTLLLGCPQAYDIRDPPDYPEKLNPSPLTLSGDTMQGAALFCPSLSSPESASSFVAYKCVLWIALFGGTTFYLMHEILEGRQPEMGLFENIADHLSDVFNLLDLTCVCGTYFLVASDMAISGPRFAQVSENPTDENFRNAVGPSNWQVIYWAAFILLLHFLRLNDKYRAWSMLGTYVKAIIEILQDVSAFLFLAFSLLIGFGVVIFWIYNGSSFADNHTTGVGMLYFPLSLLPSFLASFTIGMLGDSTTTGFAQLNQLPSPLIAAILVLFLVINVVIMNSMIALVMDSWVRVTSQKELNTLTERGQVLRNIRTFWFADKETIPPHYLIWAAEVPPLKFLSRGATYTNSMEATEQTLQRLVRKVDALIPEVASLQEKLASGHRARFGCGRGEDTDGENGGHPKFFRRRSTALALDNPAAGPAVKEFKRRQSFLSNGMTPSKMAHPLARQNTVQQLQERLQEPLASDKGESRRRRERQDSGRNKLNRQTSRISEAPPSPSREKREKFWRQASKHSGASFATSPRPDRRKISPRPDNDSGEQFMPILGRLPVPRSSRNNQDAAPAAPTQLPQPTQRSQPPPPPPQPAPTAPTAPPAAPAQGGREGGRAAEGGGGGGGARPQPPAADPSNPLAAFTAALELLQLQLDETAAAADTEDHNGPGRGGVT